jgi:hypothetical protein
MEYPVQIQMNISSTNVYPGPFVSLVTGTTRKDDSLYDILPVATDDGVEDTIYGGIAAMFGMYFDSEMNITTHGNGSGTYYPWGTLSTSLSPGIPENMNHATNKSFVSLSLRNSAADLVSFNKMIAMHPTVEISTFPHQVALPFIDSDCAPGFISILLLIIA